MLGPFGYGRAVRRGDWVLRLARRSPIPFYSIFCYNTHERRQETPPFGVVPITT